MDRDTFVDCMNRQLKLVRTEYGFTQEIIDTMRTNKEII